MVEPYKPESEGGDCCLDSRLRIGSKLFLRGTGNEYFIMTEAQLLDDEPARLRALCGLDVLDSLPEVAYDDIVRLAAELCGTPIALISLVDEDRAWVKAA